MNLRRPSAARNLDGLVIRGSSDLHLLVDVQGVILHQVPGSDEPFAWIGEHIIGSRIDDLYHPDDRAMVMAARRSLLADRKSISTVVGRLCSPRGEHRWSEAHARVVDLGEDVVMVASIRDVEDRVLELLRLTLQAGSDPLTGLANRTVLMDRLQQAMNRLQRSPGLLVVAMIDIDEFKRLNSTAGHAAGDDVLRQTAQRLAPLVRSSDTLARLGGDEFVIVAEGLATIEDAMALADRIIEAGQQPYPVGEVTLNATLSVGLAVTDRPGQGPEALLREADLALLRAKDVGRAEAGVFDHALRQSTDERHRRHQLLVDAVRQDGLRVVYQPIVDLITGRTVMAEAFFRVVEGPDGTLLDAATFSGVMDSGEIGRIIDRQVLHAGLGDLQAWLHAVPDSGFRGLALNITPSLVADHGFTASVLQSLGDHQVTPDALHLELSESTLGRTTNAGRARLTALHQAGVGIGLDDFGIGPSALSSLEALPLSYVKLHQDRVRGVMQKGPRDVLRTLIPLLHAHGLTVIAEAVEDPTHVEVLAELGCDHAQGMALAPTGPPEAVLDRISRID